MERQERMDSALREMEAAIERLHELAAEFAQMVKAPGAGEIERGARFRVVKHPKRPDQTRPRLPTA